MRYKFRASGICPNNIKVKCEGDISGPPGYPTAVYEAARRCVEEMFPGIKLKGDEPHVINYPSLKAYKK
jgi:hypothetical protein